MNSIGTQSPDCSLGIRLSTCGCLLALIAGCADHPFNAPDDAQWYPARVLQVAHPSELDDSINRRCLEGLARTTEQVAVVTVRIHRAPHVAAFAVPPMLNLQDKDRVAVNFRLCQLRPSTN